MNAGIIIPFNSGRKPSPYFGKEGGKDIYTVYQYKEQESIENEDAKERGGGGRALEYDVSRERTESIFNNPSMGMGMGMELIHLEQYPHKHNLAHKHQQPNSVKNVNNVQSQSEERKDLAFDKRPSRATSAKLSFMDGHRVTNITNPQFTNHITNPNEQYLPPQKQPVK